MKILENKTVYKCEFCNKKLFRKHAMVNHERWCNSNPDNIKACGYCKFMEQTTIEYTKFYFNGYSEGEEQKKAKAFRCTKLDKMLYPLIVEKKGLLDAYPETFEGQEPMPTVCEHLELGFP